MYTYLVADESGSVEAVVFDQTHVEPADILLIENAYTQMFRGHLTLYLGKLSSYALLGTFELAYADQPNMSHVSWAVDERNPRRLRARIT